VPRLPLLAALFSFAAFSQPTPWTLDLASSELVVKVWKTGAGASLAHDHVVRATKFSGKASLDEAGKPESLGLELLVEASSLIADEPEMRRKHHLPNTPVPENDRKTIREHLLGDEQLDATKFPTVGFKVSKIYREESGVLQCLGNLTLHGVTKELLFPITVKAADGKVEGDASVRFKTSDFGVKPYSAALGLIRNKDEVELVVHVTVKR
jgi:polyisoprenoid-binding protein YceI